MSLIKNFIGLLNSNRDPNIIYLIDDDKDILDIYEVIIENSFPELRIKKFLNVADALEELSQEVYPPRIILCDIRMPGINGLRINNMIADLGHQIPVLHISGLGGEDIHDDKYHILSKPINSFDLVRHIKTHILPEVA